MKFRTADPPWQFTNRTVGTEIGGCRYQTLFRTSRICLWPRSLDDPAHLYLWVPSACFQIAGHEAWGFEYKTNMSGKFFATTAGQGRKGFRNTTEIILFGVKGKNAGHYLLASAFNFISKPEA